jgi:hypothetical protein
MLGVSEFGGYSVWSNRRNIMGQDYGFFSDDHQGNNSRITIHTGADGNFAGADAHIRQDDGGTLDLHVDPNGKGKPVCNGPGQELCDAYKQGAGAAHRVMKQFGLNR